MIKTLVSSLFIFALLSTVSVHASPPYVKYVKQITSKYKKDVKKKHQLYCIGGGGGFFKDVEQITLFFAAYRKASIEEARELGVSVVEPLLQKINEEEKLRPYLREYPFNCNGIHIAITFFQNNNRYETNGSITNISVANNKVYYEIYNYETEKFETLLVEPYDKAREFALSAKSEQDNNAN